MVDGAFAAAPVCPTKDRIDGEGEGGVAQVEHVSPAGEVFVGVFFFVEVLEVECEFFLLAGVEGKGVYFFEHSEDSGSAEGFQGEVVVRVEFGEEGVYVVGDLVLWGVLGVEGGEDGEEEYKEEEGFRAEEGFYGEV